MVAISADNSYSQNDLFQYAETLIKESKLRELTTQYCVNNYSWLTSKPIKDGKSNKELERLRPMLLKMSPENCAKIAVKLDNLSYGESSAAILYRFEKLLEEQYSIQLMEKNVVKAKERRMKKNRVNRVQPVLVPDGRKATVSFILL